METVKLTESTEKTLAGALNGAASEVAAYLLSEGVPTVDVLRDKIVEALRINAEENVSSKYHICLTLDWLEKSESLKICMAVFFGMIKGKCAENRMRAADMYDLGLTLRAITPTGEFAMDSGKCMIQVNKVLSQLGTKISSAIASYVAQGGISKPAVLEAFSPFELKLVDGITSLTQETVTLTLAALAKISERKEEVE